MLRSDWSARPRAMAHGINAVGDPWVLLILRELAARSPCQGGRARRFAYFPTEAGADTLPLMHTYAFWAPKHTPATAT